MDEAPISTGLRRWEKAFVGSGFISGGIKRINIPASLSFSNVASVDFIKLGIDGLYYVTKSIAPGGFLFGVDLEPFYTDGAKKSISVTATIRFADADKPWSFGQKLGLTITYTNA